MYGSNANSARATIAYPIGGCELELRYARIRVSVSHVCVCAYALEVELYPGEGHDHRGGVSHDESVKKKREQTDKPARIFYRHTTVTYYALCTATQSLRELCLSV